MVRVISFVLLVMLFITGCSATDLSSIASEPEMGQVIELSRRSTASIIQAILRGHWNGFIMQDPTGNMLTLYWPIQHKGIAFWAFDLKKLEFIKDQKTLMNFMSNAMIGNCTDISCIQLMLKERGWEIVNATALEEAVRAKILSYVIASSSLTTLWMIPASAADPELSFLTEYLCTDPNGLSLCWVRDGEIVMPEIDT